MTKTATSTTFILVGFTSSILEVNSTYSYWIQVGLIFGWIGDVFLIPKGAGLFFLFGLVSFLFGHICYIIAFFSLKLDLTFLVVASVFITLQTAFIYNYLSHGATAKFYSLPVKAYIFVITLMVISAAGNLGYWWINEGSAGPHFFIALKRFQAAEMFYISDICVARQRYGKPSPWNKLLGLPFYYWAQILLAANL